jgi:hypothetical protein
MHDPDRRAVGARGEGDLDLARVSAVLAQVPEVGEPVRRLERDDLAPLGLFKGVRNYTLTPEGDGRTRFDMREEFTGPLAPLVFKSIPDMQPSFDKFAAGLKAKAESGG